MREGDDYWMTPEETAEWLAVTRDWVYDAYQQKRLPGTKLPGRQVRFHKGELREWLATER